MRYVRVLTLCVLLFAATTVTANEFNAGIVEGLWYSKEPVFADETVRMYVALRNNTGSDLTGRIIFYDNDKRLSSQAVSALNGRIIEAWTDWTPGVGSHELRVELTDVTLDSIDGVDRDIVLPDSTVTESMYVDVDTDNDGVGNSEDTDDDNDGISDEDEEENGTNPLVPDILELETGSSTENTDTTDVSDTEPDTTPNQTGTSQGLEQFFNDGPLHQSLAGLTQFFENTREDLDTYRSDRDRRLDAERETESQVHDRTGSSSGQSSVGEITRTTIPPPTEGWGERALSFIGKNLQALYGAILLGASAALARPLLLQLVLLILILLLIYKLARRLGGRGGE